MTPGKNYCREIWILRVIARIGLWVGALGSLGFMLYVGRHNNSIFLILLFTIWVLSPFVALFVANEVSKRWSDRFRITLYVLMLFITLISLVSYSGVLIPPGVKPAFIFLLIPLLSWLILVIVIPFVSRARK